MEDHPLLHLHISDVVEFENSDVWKVTKGILEQKLVMAYRDLYNPGLSVELIRLAQGATVELQCLVDLPQMLKVVAEKQAEELKQLREDD